ncbi:MAG TPA: S8/S53 family peptidase [Egibacteraceae bacterium]|nr:S8/S53 family peptidase [Egibacteraceae bacterium]
MRVRQAEHHGHRHDHDHDHGLPLPPTVGESGTGDEGEYLYERDRLVAAEAHVDRIAQVGQQLDGLEILEARPIGRLGVALLHIRSRSLAVPELVDGLRANSGRDLGVAPNHVLGRASHPAMLSVAPPRPAEERPPVQREPGMPGEGTRIGVLDTGAWDHPYFDGRCDFRDPDDLDEPDADGDGLLDFASGHGTFIAGVVLQHAPGATVVARRLPSADHGPAPHQDYVTDAQLAMALADLPELRTVDVLTLSLGGYVHDGLGLLATEAMLGDLRSANPDLVIVAGAGNEGINEPFFPAASKHVIAVAALDASGGRRACFSNYGWWVDACAPGVDVHSTFLEWDADFARYPDELPHGCEGLLDGVEKPAGDSFNGWARWDGTSFAAPHVAGAIAARISSGRSPSEAVFDVLHAPGSRRLPLLGTVVDAAIRA